MEGVILSSWDYIMGPQIERLWLINSDSKFSSTEIPLNVLRDFNVSKHFQKADLNDETKYQSNLSLYSFMCGQLLLGEMDASETFDEITSRTYISDLKILIGVVFRMKSWVYVGTIKEVKNVCVCIGFFYNREVFNFILKNQFTLDIHLRKMADFLQKTQTPHESAIAELSSCVLSLTSNLHSLCDNLNHVQDHVIPSFQDYSISGVLSKAIVSHLQTSSHTAVLGGSEFKIKQKVLVSFFRTQILIMNILTMFNNNGDIACSFSVDPQSLLSKVSKLSIHGLIKNSEKDCEHLLEQAYNESLSLTVIDTDLCRVWQTYPFHANMDKSRVFSSVLEEGCLIPELLTDLSFADKNDVDCHAIIKTFTKLLMTKAIALVKTITHFRDVKRILSKQELMTLFSIQTTVDIQILLGCAEIVKPGIRSLVL